MKSVRQIAPARTPAQALRAAGLAAAVVVGALGVSTAASAQCQLTTIISANGDWATICEDSGNAPPPQMLFTAIAFSNSTLTWGDSWAQPSQAAAEQVALSNCRKSASDCKIAVWAKHECASVAVSAADRAWASAWAPYPGNANAIALKQCQENGGTNCVVVAHPCSDD